MAHTNVQVPTYSDIAERQHLHQLQAERDFWKREADRALDELRNIPEAVEQHGFVDLRGRDSTVRLVAQPEDQAEAE